MELETSRTYKKEIGFFRDTFHGEVGTHLIHGRDLPTWPYLNIWNPFLNQIPITGTIFRVQKQVGRTHGRTDGRTHGRTNGHTHIDFWRRLHNKPLRANIVLPHNYTTKEIKFPPLVSKKSESWKVGFKFPDFLRIWKRWVLKFRAPAARRKSQFYP